MCNPKRCTVPPDKIHSIEIRQWQLQIYALLGGNIKDKVQDEIERRHQSRPRITRSLHATLFCGNRKFRKRDL